MTDTKRVRSTTVMEACGVRIVHLDKVSHAKATEIPEPDLERMASTYKMLGDPTRLRLLLALSENEMCVCDLAAFTGLTESAISHQLRRLKDLSLVKKRRDGQILYYSLVDTHVTDLLKIGLAHLYD
ncbi:MAG: metalloregulator ArsR/SmtB family transcription factor [Desulfobacterales bacterium]